MVKRFPLDTTLAGPLTFPCIRVETPVRIVEQPAALTCQDKTLDDGTKIFHALPFEVPGAISVKAEALVGKRYACVLEH